MLIFWKKIKQISEEDEEEIISCGLAFQDNGASLVSPTLSRKIYDSGVKLFGKGG